MAPMVCNNERAETTLRGRTSQIWQGCTSRTQRAFILRPTGHPRYLWPTRDTTEGVLDDSRPHHQGLRSDEVQSDIYRVPANPINGEISELLFTGTDPAWHDRQRRLVNQALTTSALTRYEPWIDDVIKAFCSQVKSRFAKTGEPMNMMEWFSFFSMDLATNITFGEPVGFIAAGKDINNGTLHKAQGGTVTWLFVSATLDCLTQQLMPLS